MTYRVNKTEKIFEIIHICCVQAYSDTSSLHRIILHTCHLHAVILDLPWAMPGCLQHELRNGGYNTAHKGCKVTTVYRDGAVLSLIICPQKLFAKEQIKERAIFHTNLFDGQVLHFSKTILVMVILPCSCSLRRRQDSS